MKNTVFTYSVVYLKRLGVHLKEFHGTLVEKHCPRGSYGWEYDETVPYFNWILIKSPLKDSKQLYVDQSQTHITLSFPN
jgi:hypothetical protein